MKSKEVKSTRTPLYRDTGFHLVDIATMKKAFADEQCHFRDPEHYIYSRYRNPNIADAEDQLMQIEGAEWGLLAESGLAAIDIALSIFQKNETPNKWLFFSEIYGGTNSFIDKVLIRRRGIHVERFAPNGDSYSLEAFEKKLIEFKPDLVMFEAISNPMLIVVDAENIIKIAKKYGVKIVVDNTFATPMLWKPLSCGADLVIHSVSKYLSGHGNLSAGVVLGNDSEICKAAIEYRKWVGHMLSPDDAYRLSDMLKTFNMRFSKHCQNAMDIANFLNVHPLVEMVLYPSLESHPTHQEALKLTQGKGFGAIITFDIKGDNFEEKADRCNRFINALAHSIPLVPTLGDADTKLLPIEPVWGDKFPFPGMIRLSVGIEESSDIIAVIEKAFNAIT